MNKNFYTTLLPRRFLACRTVGSVPLEARLESTIRALSHLDTTAFIGLLFVSDRCFRNPDLRFPPELLAVEDAFVASWHRFVDECRNRDDRPNPAELCFFETSPLFNRFVGNNLVFQCVQPGAVAIFLRQQLQFDPLRN